jgi:hypothetical protein
MTRRRWKVWAAGLSLVAVLAGGIIAAVLWPTPSAAERMASQLRVGMTMGQVGQVSEYLGGSDPLILTSGRAVAPGRSTSRIVFDDPGRGTRGIVFDDGSSIGITLDRDDHVGNIKTTPPDPVHPLTRLRHTLGRVFPALAK